MYFAFLKKFFWLIKGPIIIDFLEKSAITNSASYFQLFQ